MSKPEAKILERIIKELKLIKQTEPLFYFKIHGGPMQQAGIPDLLVWFRGKHFSLEVKAPGGIVSKIQEHTIKQILNTGNIAAVVYSYEDVQKVLGV